METPEPVKEAIAAAVAPAGPVSAAQRAGTTKVEQVSQPLPADTKTLSLPPTNGVFEQYLHEVKELLPGKLGRYLMWIIIGLGAIGFIVLIFTLHLI